MKKMKRFISFLVASVLCCTFIATAGCIGEPSNEISLSISEQTMELSLLEQKSLSIETTSTKQSTWTSSNDEAVIILGDGKSVDIVGVGVGTSIISARVENKTVSCSVTVLPTEDTLTLSLESSNLLVLSEGEDSDIETQLTFKNSEFIGATYEYSVVAASPEGCITVDDEGTIFAEESGSATVRVKASYYGNYSNEVEISVICIPMISLSLSRTEVNLYVGDEKYTNTADVSAKFNVEGSEVEATIIFAESADESIAVYEEGKIKAIGVGETTIEFTCNYQNLKDYTATVVVTVEEAPNVEFTVGNVTVQGYDVTNKATGETWVASREITASLSVNGTEIDSFEITWSVKAGDEGIASVANGIVTGLSKGSATIVATYTDDWGVAHTAEGTATVDMPVYYGQHEKYAVDGMVAKINNYTGFAIKGVDYTSSQSTQLIRFQHIPCKDTPDAGTFTWGPKILAITFQDSVDLDNYVTVGFVLNPTSECHSLTATKAGVRASTWNGTSTFNLLQGGYSDTFYGWLRDSWMNDKSVHYFNAIGITSGYARNIGGFSMFGNYLAEEDYAKYMAGISIEGTTVYIHNNGGTTKVFDLNADFIAFVDGTFGSHGVTFTEDMAWSGFTSDKINIYINSAHYGNSMNYSHVLIDTIGGQTITETSYKTFETDFGYIGGALVYDLTA